MEGRGWRRLCHFFYVTYVASVSTYFLFTFAKKNENGVFQSAVSLLDMHTRYSGFQKQVAWTCRFSSMCSNVSLETSIILKTVRGNGDITSFFVAGDRFYTGMIPSEITQK